MKPGSKAGSKALRELLARLKAAPFEIKRHHRADLSFEGTGDGSGGTKEGAARMWLRPLIRVADELDLMPDLLIVDASLGAIGLVHVIKACEEGLKRDLPSHLQNDLKKQLQKALTDEASLNVDQATYLRDLLQARGTVGGTGESALDYTVETVLVMAHEHAEAMENVVRDILTKTRFLHSTGLNLLCYSHEGEFKTDELQRAFAWLLPATRKRMANCKCQEGGRLLGLHLSNYRLPGERKWTLQEQHRVHLVHGANGTGKSSMAEALELAVTGTVERIERDHPNADYACILRNLVAATQADAKPAHVSVLFTSETPTFEFDVVSKGRISRPSLRPALPVTAFRLDQPVMDELVRSGSQQRARMLTRAFFPGEAYQVLEKAHEELTRAFYELPAEIQSEIRNGQPKSDEWPPIVITRLGWVDDMSAAAALADLLPLPRPVLELLAGIAPEINDWLSKLDQAKDRTTFESMLKSLDEALSTVRAKVRIYRDAVVTSLDALSRVGSWRPGTAQASMEYSHTLREWTERIALHDLLLKTIDVTKTVAMARQDSWVAAAESAALMSLPADVAAMTIASIRCAGEMDQFMKELLGNAVAGSAESTAVSVTSLSGAEIDSLNLTGEWWGRQQATHPAEPCGTTIQKAILGNTTVSLGPVTVGTEMWADQLVAYLTPISGALESLLAFDQPVSVTSGVTPPPIYRGPVVRLNGLKTAVAGARREVAAARQVDEALTKRLEELSPALDEIVTLLTPARWAYEGILVQAERRDGKAAVELVNSTTKSPADLRLNTAELNIIVLALYLLCGPTIDNPLSTIILDDPLQNMDELTASTVARGVAKISGLMPKGWQLIIMFHGDEDLEAFTREIRGCVYRLPWLGPLGVVTDSDPIVDPSRNKSAETKQMRIGAIIQQSPKQLNQMSS